MYVEHPNTTYWLVLAYVGAPSNPLFSGSEASFAVVSFSQIKKNSAGYRTLSLLTVLNQEKFFPVVIGTWSLFGLL